MSFAKKSRYLLMTVPILLSTLIISPYARAENNNTVEAEKFDSGNYGSYIEKYADCPELEENILIAPDNLSDTSAASVCQIDGKNVVMIEEGGYAEFTFSVPQESLSTVELCYYNPPSGGNDINVAFETDGSAPFPELNYQVLRRRWRDEYMPGTKKDSRNNDILPSQTEENLFQTVMLSDSTGTYSEPYYIHWTAGEHRLKIISNSESVAICSLLLTTPEELKDYDDLSEEYLKNGYKQAESFKTYEAECVTAKSDATLYATSDRSSPYTTPYRVDSLPLNMIGGTSFSTQGQWLEWTVEAKESGLYKIAFRARQNTLSGAYVCRKIYVDGAVPCNEYNDVHFNYSSKWQNVVLPAVYLEKGKHTLRMEVTVGDLSEIVSEIENAVSELNYAYRQIIMITTANPDRYRDYELDEYAPGVFEIFRSQKEVLDRCNAELIEKTGKRGSMNSILQTFSVQLEEFIKKPETVQTKLSAYKTNISSLSSWVSQIKTQALELDKIYLCAEESRLPKAEAGFAEKILHEIRSFFASFYVDYSSIGEEAGDGEDTIDVWVQAGRDQATVIQRLVTSKYKSENCSGVNIKLVQGQLLAATASGRGPDVALQTAASDPVNYAVRGAAYNLKSFSDFEEVSKRFRQSAFIPYEFNGGVYALPETQTFQVMFYRKDILDEMGLDVPKSWNELFLTLGRLQKKNMTIGIPVSLSTISMFLYQRGGELYTENNSKSGLSSVAAQDAFSQWISFYTDYSVPVSYNALDRFRTGEMPIVIEDFSFYNTLQASAPEIQGMWEFTGVPGTVSENGSIDSTAVTGGISCMMLSGTSNPEASWDFMKWWTDDEIQRLYGEEIENRMGASARYSSANVAAFERMPWSVSQLKTLNGLWDNVKAIPEVAGGYFTARHINNAFRRVINYGEDTKLTLLSYVENIDDEIAVKRKELGIK